MDLADKVAHFEQLCSRVASGGDVAAQAELVALQESGSVSLCLSIARAVLDAHNKPPQLLFQALSVLEAALLRSPEPSSLHVMRYLLERTGKCFLTDQKFVTRKTLFVIATIYKRSFQPSRVEVSTEVDCQPSEFREEVWHVLGMWVNEQAWERKLLAIELLRNIFSNFLISCSRSLGLTIDYHYRCHSAFEELYLRKVYFMSKQIIDEALSLQSAPSPVCLAALRTSLEVLVDLLQWNWNATVSLSTYIWAAVRSLNERTSVSASPDWVSVFKSPVLFDMLGMLFRRFRRVDPELGRLSLRGFEQMASFLVHSTTGSNTTGGPTFVEYLLNAIGQLLTVVTAEGGAAASANELMMVASIMSRLACNQHVKLLMALPSWFSFLQSFGLFSELCCSRLLAVSSNPRLRAEEDVEDLESSRQMIAFSNALHAWSIFAKYAVYRTATDTVARPDHPDPAGPAMTALKESLGLVFVMYVKTRLQLAQNELKDGSSQQARPSLRPRSEKAASGGGGGGGSGGGGDEDGPVEEELSDQLLDGALCGRAHLRSAVPLLGSLVSDAARKLAALDRGGSAVPEWLHLVEELHWLLLMAGHLVADSSEWEHSSSIPRIVSQHEANTGTVLQLIRAVFNLLDWEGQCINSNRRHHLSPLLSATLLWFCDRVVRSYLFRQRRPSDGVASSTPRLDNTPDSFIQAFNSLPLLNQFVELVLTNLRAWQGNAEVLLPTCRLLRSICSINRLAQRLPSLPVFPRLVQGAGQWTLAQVNPPFHRKIVAALLIARVSDNAQQCEAYVNNLLSSLSVLAARLTDPSFAHHDQNSVLFCATLLEKLNGVVDGTVSGNCVQIRNFVFGCLSGFQRLMEVYKSDPTLYVPLVRLCTRFVQSQVDNCSAWTAPELDRIFDASLSVIKFCRSGALLMPGARWTKAQEQEQYHLVRRLVLLLTALHQLVQAGGSGNSGREVQTDVIYFGLGALLQHMNEQLLDFPKLQFSYFRLLKRLLNSAPARFGQLPPELFSRLISTLLFAVKTAVDEKVALCALKGLSELFGEHAKHGILRVQQGMNGMIVSSLVVATFLLLLRSNMQPGVVPAASSLLRHLAASDQSAFSAALRQMANSAATPSGAATFQRAGVALFDRVNLSSFEKEQEELFRDNVKAFVLETRGIEWAKK